MHVGPIINRVRSLCCTVSCASVIKLVDYAVLQPDNGVFA